MTQAKAIKLARKILGYECDDAKECKGPFDCRIDECFICGIRDCPSNEPLHYHHDGCPACYKTK